LSTLEAVVTWRYAPQPWALALSAIVRLPLKAFESFEPDLEVEMSHPLLTQRIAARHDSIGWVASFGSTLVPVAVGLASFVVTEFMHYLLVPDMGRLWERLLAEGFSAAVVALLTAGLIHEANQRRDAARLRMQVIAEMNHHIRNALAAISLSTDMIQNQQSIQVISESVDRIEWALREVLPRSRPLAEEDRNRAFYFGVSHVRGRQQVMQVRSSGGESHEETKWII
jgi:signal transduction histidine kinase